MLNLIYIINSICVFMNMHIEAGRQAVRHTNTYPTSATYRDLLLLLLLPLLLILRTEYDIEYSNAIEITFMDLTRACTVHTVVVFLFSLVGRSVGYWCAMPGGNAQYSIIQCIQISCKQITYYNCYRSIYHSYSVYNIRRCGASNQ